MSQGVDEHGRVKHDKSADHEPPNESRRTADGEAHQRVAREEDPVVSVDPAKLGITRQVAHVRPVDRRRSRAIEYPADMRMEETALDRRMRVIRTIGVLVMAAMDARPPYRPV